MHEYNLQRHQTRIACRRTNMDRRGAFSPFNLKHLGVGARRKNPRRGLEEGNNYVDFYEPHFFFLTLSIIFMSCFDALMTINLIESGKAIELNPFMAVLIRKDILSFFGVKYALTALSLFFLVIHKNFTLFGSLKVSHLIYASFGGYLTLIVYEIFIKLY